MISATQAATGLADLHNIDHEGRPSIAHTDISPGQFIKIGNRYKLNDFNRARFLLWNVKKDKPCGYYVDRNPGRNRSPEEYSYSLQSEKVVGKDFIFHSGVLRCWNTTHLISATTSSLLF